MSGQDRLLAGIELGGTKAIALMARGRDVLASARVPTTTPNETLRAIGDRIEAWQREHGRADALGIASFGPLGLDRSRPDYGHITSTPKPGWRQADLVRHFGDRFGLPIGFDTDVAGAALAEHRWGTARGCDVAIYMTVGTGVGGGVVVDGRPVHGLVHPELGHLRVRRATGDDFAGVCPFHGDCLEGLVSGPAIGARTGIDGASIEDDHPVWDRVTAELAEAMAMLLLTVSPRRIVIGGGVLQQRAPLFGPLRKRTAALLGGYIAGLDEDALAAMIVPPELGAMAGPLGAIALAQDACQDRSAAATATSPNTCI
ncbi:ROK family protein [Rhizorhabdus histidinilytica]|uniref:ROK family protein n=1 Tax=Rhizorhabdus histidinilytica TaxID=439228 RepID=UPI00322091D8